MVQVRFTNDTTPIEVTSETQETQITVRSETSTRNHNELVNRNMADQHPITAITGLQNALNNKQNLLIAGEGINIVDNVISCTGGSGGNATWGSITGTISNQIDLSNLLNGKQDIISDLSTIRSGASAGATAIQPNDLASVATSGSYNDLINKPTIPIVNNATLTIQKNGLDVATFTANASSNVTANIAVPTDTGDLTNNAGFITNSAITNMQTTANLVTSVSSSSTDSQYPSAKLLYDTVGNIESAINTIRGV